MVPQITSLTIVCSTRRRSERTSKLRVTGLCVGNSPVTGEFPTQRASNAEDVSILWRHHMMAERGYPVFVLGLPMSLLLMPITTENSNATVSMVGYHQGMPRIKKNPHQTMILTFPKARVTALSICYMWLYPTAEALTSNVPFSLWPGYVIISM